MGGGSWSDDFYAARKKSLKDSGKSAFDYSERMSVAPEDERKCHELLEPKRKNSAGQVIRESRDSAEHPESLAVAVFFDVTGSMREIPVVLQEKLPKLMGLLIRKGYVEHPQILFGAIGDATCDVAPLQVGQFESSNEMDEDLSRFFCEGGGGPYITESYQNALYFMARHSAIDCFEKRGRKGYLFMIGDEISYDFVNRGEVRELIEDKIQTDIPTSEIVAELKKMYHVFFIIPRGASNAGSREINRYWTKLLGQEGVIMLDDAANVCECIAAAIGIGEERVGIAEAETDLVEVGVSKAVAHSVTEALVPFAKAKDSLAKVDIGSLPKPSGKGGTRRL